MQNSQKKSAVLLENSELTTYTHQGKLTGVTFFKLLQNSRLTLNSLWENSYKTSKTLLKFAEVFKYSRLSSHFGWAFHFSKTHTFCCTMKSLKLTVKRKYRRRRKKSFQCIKVLTIIFQQKRAQVFSSSKIHF